MTQPPGAALAGLPAPLAALLAAAAREFVELGFAGTGGRLTLDLPPGSIRGLRLEVPGEGELHLRGVVIEAGGVADVSAVASVAASSVVGGVAQDPARLLVPDGTFATQLRTGHDGPAWVEIRFTHPVDVRQVTVLNAYGPESRLARGIQVSSLGRWRRHTLYAWRPQVRAWRDRVARALQEAEASGDADTAALIRVVDLVVRGEYLKADRHLRSKVADTDLQRRLKRAADDGLLRARELEWTTHGPNRSFRWWTEAQKEAYLREAVAIVDTLRGLTPSVCLGFGSVLAVVRDGALIPHDDDLDVIIAFEPDEARSIDEGMERLERYLPPLGYVVSGTNYSHRQVYLPDHRTVDVFSGVFEGDTASWWPGPRGGLARDVLFPATTRELMGVACPVPADPETYLERVYGTDWRVPDPNFKHARNMAEFADIAGTPETSAGPEAGDA